MASRQPVATRKSARSLTIFFFQAGTALASLKNYQDPLALSEDERSHLVEVVQTLVKCSGTSAAKLSQPLFY